MENTVWPRRASGFLLVPGAFAFGVGYLEKRRGTLLAASYTQSKQKRNTLLGVLMRVSGRIRVMSSKTRGSLGSHISLEAA